MCGIFIVDMHAVANTHGDLYERATYLRASLEHDYTLNGIGIIGESVSVHNACMYAPSVT